MNNSFAIVSNTLPTRCHMTNDISNFSNSVPVDVGTELFVDCSNLVEKNNTLWIYSPITKMYYELYKKDTDTALLKVYPTMYAEVTSDCKAGLALYKNCDSSSDIIVRRDVEELYEITPMFQVDERGNIWVYSVNINEDNPGNIENKLLSGWLIYKNIRNNFANLYIHGKYKSLLTGGSLDPNKVSKFTEWLWEVKFKDWYKILQPLQLFASSDSKKSIKSSTGGGKTISIEEGSFYSKFTPTETREDTTETFKNYHSWNGSKAPNSKTGGIGDFNNINFFKNTRDFPYKSDNYTEDKSMGRLNYFIKDKDIVSDEIDTIRKRMMFDNDDSDEVMRKINRYYNRFKIATPGDFLGKGVPHIFFTRPDCNLYKSGSAKSASELNSKVKADSNFNYAFYHKPLLLEELSQDSTLSDDWLWLLSNKITSFQPSDESIGTDKYGTTYYKQSIAYGRTNYESKAAGEITCSLQDNKDLDVFHLHKLWTDYISNVYCGKWIPKKEYLWQKIIDYACSVYYIITSEDGESIIFWSKYYGVFPTNVPSSSYGWNGNSFIENQSLSISYQYSFKEDFNPQSLIELNLNSHLTSDVTYAPVYDETLGMSARTWVGSPFVETVKNGTDYSFKLRFKKL